MLRGIEHIRDAVRILTTAGSPMKGRLYAASERFWTAAASYGSWPREIQQETILLESMLLGEEPTFLTIREMDDDTAAFVAAELLRFAREFESASGREDGQTSSHCAANLRA